MKKCSRCNQLKPLTEFGSHKTKHDGKCCYCLECKSTQVREYYASNEAYRQQTKERAAEAKRRNKIAVYKYLLVHPCVDCGEADVIVLDFDHRDPSLKRESVSTLSRQAVKWQTVQDEIDKCDVRCSNCHRKRTALQFDGYSLLEEAKRQLNE